MTHTLVPRPQPQSERAPTRHLRIRRWSHTLPAEPSWPAGQHDAVEVAFPERGKLRYLIGERSFRIAEGEAMVVAPHEEHRTVPSATLAAGSIWLGTELVAEIAEAMGRPGRVASGVVPDAARLIGIGRLLLAELAAGGAGDALLTDALAEALVIQLLRGAETSSRTLAKDPRIGRALELIESEPEAPLTVDQLAATAHMSRFHFTRCFKEVVGKSPYQYLTHVRVARAAELMRSGRVDVTEAAFAAGFADLSRFSRAFQRQLGCRPSAWRARFAERTARSA